MRNGLVVAMLGIALVGCAGRDPQPIVTVQAQDTVADCTMIRAEIEANNAKVTQLANEQGWKVAQNVGAGVVGLVIWPVWFGMDFKDAAGKEAATERCRPAAAPATSQRQPAARQKTARAPAPAHVAPPPPPSVPQIAAPEPEPQLAPYQDAPH